MNTREHDPHHLSLHSEQQVCRMRRHAGVLVFPFLILIATSTASGMFLGSFREEWKNQGAFALAAALLLFGVIFPILSWSTKTVRITNLRVIVSSGVLHRKQREVLLSDIVQTRVSRSLGQRLAGSGTIEFDLGNGSVFSIPSVPSVKSVCEMLQQLVERGKAMNRYAYEAGKQPLPGVGQEHPVQQRGGTESSQRQNSAQEYRFFEQI